VRTVGYQLQNVGSISNRGWELQATSRWRALSTSASLSLVDSRVRSVARGYSGDLRVGDRMLQVPARTMSIAASWTQLRWTAGISASRASDWIGYDRLSLADSSVAGAVAGSFVGGRLRDFWTEYDGALRLRATASRTVRRGVSVLFAGDNLMNVQQGEPDNITVVPGRTLQMSLRVDF
jgi:iron complex outermembrane receptor protein